LGGGGGIRYWGEKSSKEDIEHIKEYKLFVFAIRKGKTKFKLPCL
jgi:hypothetical protein